MKPQFKFFWVVLGTRGVIVPIDNDDITTLVLMYKKLSIKYPGCRFRFYRRLAEL